MNREHQPHQRKKQDNGLESVAGGGLLNGGLGDVFENMPSDEALGGAGDIMLKMITGIDGKGNT